MQYYAKKIKVKAFCRIDCQEDYIEFLIGLVSIFYYEMLPYGQTLNSELCQQPYPLKLTIDQKWTELVTELLCVLSG